jgi:RNA polymerase sigma factor (sigma-70 family)
VVRPRPPVAVPEPAEPEQSLRLVDGPRYTGWEAVYRDNVERIYRLLFARVGNQPDAEDLTAEVFLAALPRLRESASVGEVRAYLIAVSRTVLADHWRRTLGRQLTTIDPDTLAEHVDDPATDSPARVALVERVLGELPERYGMILRLRFLEAATIREAARRLDISIANAKVLQYRALRQAARLMDGK